MTLLVSTWVTALEWRGRPKKQKRCVSQLRPPPQEFQDLRNSRVTPLMSGRDLHTLLANPGSIFTSWRAVSVVALVASILIHLFAAFVADHCTKTVTGGCSRSHIYGTVSASSLEASAQLEEHIRAKKLWHLTRLYPPSRGLVISRPVFRFPVGPTTKLFPMDQAQLPAPASYDSNYMGPGPYAQFAGGVSVCLGVTT